MQRNGLTGATQEETLANIERFFAGFTYTLDLKNNAEEGILLPATTLTSGCYKGMFSGCTGLSQVTINATDISAANCLCWSWSNISR